MRKREEHRANVGKAGKLLGTEIQQALRGKQKVSGLEVRAVDD